MAKRKKSSGKKKKGRKVPSYVKKTAKLKRSRGKTVKSVSKQKPTPTTKRGLKLDEKRKAKPPGWRVSRSGRIYFENRRNRSDLPGKRI